jgi:hypothetical protein
MVEDVVAAQTAHLQMVVLPVEILAARLALRLPRALTQMRIKITLDTAATVLPEQVLDKIQNIGLAVVAVVLLPLEHLGALTQVFLVLQKVETAVPENLQILPVLNFVTQLAAEAVSTHTTQIQLQEPPEELVVAALFLVLS